MQSFFYAGMLKIAVLFAKEFNQHPVVYREAMTLKKAGHEVAIYAWDRSSSRAEEENVDGIRIINIHGKSEYGSFYGVLKGIWRYYLGLLRKLGSAQYDVVMAYDQYAIPVAVLLSKLHGKPVVYNVLDIYYLDMPDGPLKKALEKVDRRLAKSARAVKVPCDVFAKHYDNRNTTVVWNCPEKDLFVPGHTGHEDFVIAYFGNIRWIEPFRILFKAMGNVKGVRVKIGGEGIYMNEVKALAERYDNIYIEGFVPFEKIAERYREIDMLYVVYPRNHAPILYSIPMKIFEAMACGIPVAVNDVGFTADFVKKHGVGVVVDGDDAAGMKDVFLKMRDSEDLRSEMGRRGRRLVETEYNWENMGRRFLSIFEDIEKDLYEGE